MGVVNPALYELPRIHTMQATAECKDAIRSQVSVRDHVWTVDEPVLFGGTDLGAAPLEYALGSAAAVTNCLVTLVGEEMGIDVTLHRVDIKADLDTWGFLGKAPVATPFPGIVISIEGESSAKPQDVDRLFKEMIRRDPFSQMFAATGAEVVHDWNISPANVGQQSESKEGQE